MKVIGRISQKIIGRRTNAHDLDDLAALMPTISLSYCCPASCISSTSSARLSRAVAEVHFYVCKNLLSM